MNISLAMLFNCATHVLQTIISSQNISIQIRFKRPLSLLLLLHQQQFIAKESSEWERLTNCSDYRWNIRQLGRLWQLYNRNSIWIWTNRNFGPMPHIWLYQATPKIDAFEPNKSPVQYQRTSDSVFSFQFRFNIAHFVNHAVRCVVCYVSILTEWRQMKNAAIR